MPHRLFSLKTSINIRAAIALCQRERAPLNSTDQLTTAGGGERRNCLSTRVREHLLSSFSPSLELFFLFFIRSYFFFLLLAYTLKKNFKCTKVCLTPTRVRTVISDTDCSYLHMKTTQIDRSIDVFLRVQGRELIFRSAHAELFFFARV